ncbi:unnamed protein product [Paramecium pentaurelia]|uniref:G domain-containing protein n=1 Tax=Paramecium pentaurelia TaxID=43138 RepID=A0A8S1WHF0_9CILI|nr:unnamed protein product [Paramecium pentaurelia]
MDYLPYCQIHDQPIIFLDLQPKISKGKRALCRFCELNGPTPIEIALGIKKKQINSELEQYNEYFSSFLYSIERTIKDLDTVRSQFSKNIEQLEENLIKEKEKLLQEKNEVIQNLKLDFQCLTITQLQNIGEELSQKNPQNSQNFEKNKEKFDQEINQIMKCKELKILSDIITLQDKLTLILNQKESEPNQNKGFIEYSLNKEELYLKQKNHVLLIGGSGSGKTTLFNKITNSNLNVEQGQSITSDIYIKNSQYGEGFTLFDTPGYVNQGMYLKTLPAYLYTLENFEISRIVVVIRFNRLYNTIDSYDDILTVFQRYKDKITIVITFFDQCIKKEYVQNQIISQFQQHNIKSIIFTQIQDTGESLCKLLDTQIKSSYQQKIQLKETEIIQILKLEEDKNCQCDIKDKEYNLICKLKKILKQPEMNKIDNIQQFQSSLEQIILQVIKTNFQMFQRIEKKYVNQFQEFLYLQSFINFTNGQIKQILIVAEQKINKIQWDQQKIKLQKYINNQMISYDNSLEIALQKCINMFKSNVKNVKFYYYQDIHY